MIIAGIMFAGILTVLGLLSRAEVKPSLCPVCLQRTLVPDHRGVVWRCVPCSRQFIRVGARLVSDDRGDRLAVARLRAPHDHLPTESVRIPGDDKPD